MRPTQHQHPAMLIAPNAEAFPHPYDERSGGDATLANARQAARVWSSTVATRWRIAQAATFARTAVDALRDATYPTLPLSGRPPEFDGALDQEAWLLARGIGQAAAKRPILEAIYIVTSLYPALLPPDHRSVVGAFYTPPVLAGRLLDLAEDAKLDWSSARVFDPAAGAGAFLAPAADRMRRALSGADPGFVLAQIGARLLGLELDPHAAYLAQLSVELVLADIVIAAGRAAPKVVHVCDTIEEPPRPDFDLVVGNPPYGRMTLTAEQRTRFARSLYGHANLYGVFTDLALRWAKPDGLVAYLTPTSMLGGQYFSALRELLAREAPPISIDFVHARRGVFEDVLQETLLALYRRGAKPQRVQVHYITVQSDTSAELTRNGTVALPANPRAPWMAPRSAKHGRLIAGVERMPTRLSDWGYGVSTGPLVWNRFKTQLTNKAGPGVYPLIWAEAITADGRFIHRADKRGHKPWFALKTGDAWLRSDRGCLLLQRTTAKEQPRRLIVAELPDGFVRRHGGVVVENHLNMVQAKARPKVSLAALAAMLNSRTVDEVFRCISGSVAVSAFELEALPLPSVEQMAGVEALVRAGSAPEAIEAAIAQLYGVDKA